MPSPSRSRTAASTAGSSPRNFAFGRTGDRVDIRDTRGPQDEEETTIDTDVIGLIPAAGLAERIGPLPGSKELFPVGFRRLGEDDYRPKPVCHYLLEAFRAAGIERAFFILRRGKWDIPAYLGDGAPLGLHLGYLVMGLPHGAPYTLDQAHPFLGEARVALGFPDIIFEPVDAYSRLLARQEASGADIVLGLFPTDEPQKVDTVEVDGSHRVVRVEIKDAASRLRRTWGIAVWTPVFTRYLHERLAALAESGAPASRRERFVGDIIQAAIIDGLAVEAIDVSTTPFVDIGTPDNLVAAVRRFAGPERAP